MDAPKKLGKYEIRRELGKGAMGVVYEGFDPTIERVVALKTIRADQLGGEDAAEIMARFRREAQAAGRLNHPRIVSIYEYGEDAGTTFIAMEFVAGRSLRESFEQNARFSVPQIVRIMSQLLEALDYSHRQGVVHRDIKPANIMLLADGTVKVADFGIARIESSNLTQTGMILGTPSYMSPEQFMGQKIDGRSDLFSSGVILYQLLTGERPFTGSPTTIMHKVLQENPLPPSQLNVQAPRPFDQVVKRALEKRPEDRFQTASEFAQAIRAAADAHSTEPTVLSTTAERDPDRTRTMERTTRRPAEPATQAATSVPPPARRKSQAAAIAILAGVVVIGLAAVVGYALLSRDRAPEPRAAVASPGQPAAPAAAPPLSAAPAVATLVPAPAAEPPKADPGTVLVTALGIVDPSDGRYKADSALLQSDLRADSRSQAVEKALGLYLDSASLARNYEVLRDKLLSRSGSFIADVVQESAPETGKDGLVSLTTSAIVNVKALQKSLNQMSHEERIEFIRNNGDPKVAVRVAVRDADNPGAPTRSSPIAENLLKERIKSFGFRTWSDEGEAAGAQAKSADFTVVGEARVKRLAAKLPASGLTVTKFTLSSWTVKCIDRQTGEEIYFNNALPKGIGSWASEEEALAAIGGKIADEFSRDFFLQNFPMAGQKVTLRFDGPPDAVFDRALVRELASLPTALSVAPRSGESARVYDVVLAGAGAASDIVAGGVLKPLNAKLGQACFALGASSAGEVAVGFDQACAEPAVIGRLEANPPAALYAAPAARTKSVVKNPETLKKLAI